MATIKKQLTLTFKQPNIAESYGPYTSISAAHTALSEDQLNVVGMTIGIQTGNTIEEYWYQGGTTEAHLVKKETDTTQLEQTVDGINENYLKAGQSSGSSSVDFDAFADTIHNNAQILSSTQKQQARQNIDAQKTLESGVNIKTINGESLIGSGNITIDYSELSNQPQINSIILSGNKSALALGLATASQGTKADNAIPMPTGGSNEQILAKDSNETAGVKWVPKPSDGKSALQIYNETYGTNLNEVQFIDVLKQNYPMEYVAYDATAAAQTIGTGFASIGTLAADSTTAGKLYLMPNDGTTPTGTILFVTVQTPNSNPATYQWYSLGALSVPSNVLTEDNIDNDFAGGSDKVAGANEVKTINDVLFGTYTEVLEIQTSLVSNKYYSTNRVVDGVTHVGLTTTVLDGVYCAKFDVSPGDKFRITGKGGNQYVALFATCAADNSILIRMADLDISCRDTPFELTIQEGEGRLVINLSEYDSTTDKIEKYVRVLENEGLTNEVESLTEDVQGLVGTTQGLAEDVEGLTNDVESLKEATEDCIVQTQVENTSTNGDYGTVLNTPTFSGVGCTICKNSTLYKVRVSIGNRDVNDKISKVKLVLRKDNKDGDILYQNIIDVDYNDTNTHVCWFDFSNTPVTYSGEICATIQVDKTKFKIGVLTNSSYVYDGPALNTTSTDLNSDDVFVVSSGSNSPRPFFTYIDGYDVQSNLLIGSDNIENESVTTQKLGEDVMDLINPNSGVKVYLPSKFNVVEGENFQLFYKSIISVVDISSYNVEVSVYNRVSGRTAGHAYPRYYSFLTSNTSIGLYDMTINVRDSNNNILSTATSVLNVISKPTSPQSEKNILLVGASTIATGFPGGELKRRLTESSGTEGNTLNPLGLGLSNVNFVGRLTGHYVDIHQEATGGWGWNNFTSAGVPRYRFYITDGSGIYVTVNDAFTISGLTFTVRERNIEQGVGNISCTYTGTLIGEFPTQGSFTISGNTVNYSDAVSENTNPFWNNNTIDFANYSNLYCDGKTIDILLVKLGTNNIGGNTWDLTQIMTNVQSFISAYHSYNQNGKVILCSEPLPDSTGGMGYDYGAAGVLSNFFMIAKRIMEYLNAINGFCDNNSSFVTHCALAPVCDCENMYPKYTMKLNNRTSQTEKVGSNAWHPALHTGSGSSIVWSAGIGDYLMADALYNAVCSVI